MEIRKDVDELGMWVFIASEMLFFGGLFLGYLVYRYWHPKAFAEGSRECDLVLGTLNTLILITSSFFMALAVEAAKINRRRRTLWLLTVVAGLGILFLFIKGHEYMDKIHLGLYPGLWFNTDHTAYGIHLFFSFYFAMTGLHAIHLIVGLGLLAWIFTCVWRQQMDKSIYMKVNVFAMYWHFVDIIWIFLFPFFYLVGRHV